MIFWLIINMIILLSYGILLISLKIAQRNGEVMAKNILLLLRRMDIHEVDNELFDNAKQNLEEENSKRVDLIYNLNEFGIYLMMRGLSNNEYVKFPTQIFAKSFINEGFTRCNICLRDFELEEPIKAFPSCGHNFHFKCLELWVTLDPSCPTCKLYYQGIKGKDLEKRIRLKQVDNNGHIRPSLHAQEHNASSGSSAQSN